MHLDDLTFDFPQELIATSPSSTRVLCSGPSCGPREISIFDLKNEFKEGDVLVRNNTRVVPRRVLAEAGGHSFEILFLKYSEPHFWQVLMPLRYLRNCKRINMPGNVKGALVSSGRIQKIRVNQALDDGFFEKFGELPLPPYIINKRGVSHNRQEDRMWYQSAWAKCPGSVAAPTASLHFSNEDISDLRKRGVQVLDITLHVGAGTFLPITEENLSDHVMHREWVEIPGNVWKKIKENRGRGSRIWVLGTTVCRALESQGLGRLTYRNGTWSGETDLFIQEGFHFQYTDMLMTNFHQPRSTLLALVFAFAGRHEVLSAYRWALKRKFALFSYGDLTVWGAFSSFFSKRPLNLP